MSLILATIGRTQEVGRLIQSLLSQTDRRFQLIVVDQNPDDRLVPFVHLAQEGGLDVLHERMEKPGLSAARNRGISLAKYDILAFPDDDCWYEDTVIERVIRSFQVDDLGGLVARWVEQAGTEPARSYRLDLKAWRSFRGGHASSISLFLNQNLFHQLGGFDERLGVGGWYGAAEETDLVLRALDCGARLEHVPDIQVHHAYNKLPAGGMRRLLRDSRRRGRGTGAIYAKHRLGPYVILRGLTAPVITALPKCLEPRWLMRGLFTSLGRLEGYLRWRFKES